MRLPVLVMDDEKLIECVKKNAAIFDIGHHKYLDSNHKLALWKKIGQEMKEPDIECKKRWINIRDQFRKSLNRRKSKNDPTQKKYKYEENLQFLMPHMQDKPTLTNANPTSENNDDSFIECVLQSSSDIGEEDSIPNSNGIEVQLTDQKQKKRKTIQDCVYPLLNPDEKHPIDAFLEGLGPTLKNLPPYYQHLAKGEIFAIVQNLEAAAFFSGSSQPATPQSSSSGGSSISH